MRILQKKNLDLVVLYLVGAHLDDQIRALLLDSTIVAFDDANGLSPKEVCAQLGLDRVRLLVLIGYSAGVGAVRSAIVNDLLPEHDRFGAVLIDGTHASIPPERWQIEVWRKLGEEARRGEVLCVATCSNNVYTAKLSSPFMPTLHVLRAAFEPTLFPANPPHEVHAGDLHLYAYASDECDKEAHVRQQMEVLPIVLEKHVRLWLERVVPRQTPLEVAQSYVGWKEDGSNRGAIVRASLAGCVRDNRPLGIREGVPWCAAFVGLCDFEAGEDHAWRASVRELVADAIVENTWREIDYVPSPGDLAVFKRDEKDPRFGAEWHVERVEHYESGVFVSIGGNVNGQVSRRTFTTEDAELVGWIVRTGLSVEERALVETNVATSLKRFASATLGG